MFTIKTLYVDNGATTAVDERVVKAMSPYVAKLYGNASSQHSVGFSAKEALDSARRVIAASIGARSEEIIFTSGGTEGNNLAIKGIAFANKQHGNHIITTKIEHKCVLESCKWLETQGFRVTYLDVDTQGFVDLDELEKAITNKTILVSVMQGNNEIGTIQPVAKIGEICRKHKVYFHTDACQSFTKVPIDVKKDKIDLMTLNAHKIHGPKGVGALYISTGTRIEPLLHGGDQEFGLRAGTENIPGVVGFAKAVAISSFKDARKMSVLRDTLITELLEVDGAKLNGAVGDKRLCNNVNVFFLGVDGQALGGYLDRKNIMTSTGSACTAVTEEPSYVLQEIGLSKSAAASSIRITLHRDMTEGDVMRVAQAVKKTVKKLTKKSFFDTVLEKL